LKGVSGSCFKVSQISTTRDGSIPKSKVGPETLSLDHRGVKLVAQLLTSGCDEASTGFGPSSFFLPEPWARQALPPQLL